MIISAYCKQERIGVNLEPSICRRLANAFYNGISVAFLIGDQNSPNIINDKSAIVHQYYAIAATANREITVSVITDDPDESTILEITSLVCDFYPKEEKPTVIAYEDRPNPYQFIFTFPADEMDKIKEVCLPLLTPNNTALDFVKAVYHLDNYKAEFMDTFMCHVDTDLRNFDIYLEVYHNQVMLDVKYVNPSFVSEPIKLFIDITNHVRV